MRDLPVQCLEFVSLRLSSMAQSIAEMGTSNLNLALQLLKCQGPERLASSKVEDVIMEAGAMVDVASVVRVGCGILQNMIEMYPYRSMNRELIELRQALLQLDPKVDEIERSDLDFQSRVEILRRIRVLGSRTYAEVESEWAANQVPTGSDEFLDQFFDSYDHPEKWKAVTATVRRVLNDLTSILHVPTVSSQSRLDSDHYQMDNTSLRGSNGGNPSALVRGLNELTTLGVFIDKDCDRELKKGRSVKFPISCASNPVYCGRGQMGLVYRLESWTVDAEGNTGRLRKRKLSARVECSQDRDDDDIPKIRTIYHITREARTSRVPRYPKERYAFITTPTGILHAQVRSVLPKDPPVGCWGEPLVGAGTLLERGHTDYDVDNDYVSQDYAVDVMLAKTAIEGLAGGGRVRQLRIEGVKRFRETYYVCFVETSNEREVMAIYRHNLKHGMSFSARSTYRQEARSDGLFHFLGLGNHPLLRDLIVCSFVAMGLTSDL